jgi:PAS domain S-box-containing protein
VDPPAGGGYALQPLPGAVWRRRLVHLTRFRVGDLHVLDGSDPWVAREFFGVEEVPKGDGTAWLPTDLLLGLLRGADNELLGIVKLAAPLDGRRPSESLQRDLGAIMRHLASRIAYDSLRGLAQQRAERLQRLQEAGAALARSLDEHEILRELARQAARVTRADGVSFVFPDLDQDILTTALFVVRGVERQRGLVRLGDGIIAEVARTGEPVRVGDREADRARERAGLVPPLSVYDVVGDASNASSVLAVPLRTGITLIGVLAVFAASREQFSADDQEVLATMASQAATAIANARRYAESERERRQTEALAEVAKAVGESLRLGEVLRLILRHSVALLGAEGACIALRQDDFLHIVAAVGAADVLAGVHLPVASSLLGRAVMTNELIVSNDFERNPHSSKAVQRLAAIQRTVIAPLMTGRGTIGAIAVINRDRPFLDDDARVLQRLADHVAVAIVNARLFEEVERATREWKLAFDSIASGMVVLDDAHKVRRCNTRAAELCGTNIASLLGRPFRQALLGDAESPETQAFDLLLRQSVGTEIAKRELVRDNAGSRLFEVLIAPHPDGGCVLTFDDVTSVHRLAERHRRVLETVSDAIVITNLDGRVSFANAAAHELFAYDRLVDRPVATLTAPESHQEVLARERDARDGVQQRYECVVVRSDGERRLVAVSSAPLVEVGQITGTVASLRDMTEHRAEAAALARSEDRYARLVESAADAIFTVDVHGRFTSVNHALVTATGLSREELLGAPCTMLIDESDVPAVERLIANSFSGTKDRLELRFRSANGMTRVGTVNSAPIMEGGSVVGALGIMRDITGQELLRESNAQQARLAAVGQLLSGVANELNNPLASLLAVAELESATMVPGSAHAQVIAQIQAEAQRASQIVSQLRESTSDVAGTRRSLDMNRILRGSLDLHGYHFRRQQIAVEMDLAETLPWVHADAMRMQQVLTNLLTNAEDALRDWPHTRVVSVRSRAESGQVIIEIGDSGPGIDRSAMNRVFEPMFTTRNARGGRGLGLAVSRAIVEEQGGTLTASSAEGGGARFVLRLPVQATLGAESMVLAKGADPSASAVQAPMRRLLLVEDEVTLCVAMGRFLRREGYVVDTVSDGREALTLIAAHVYDVILLDLRLADMHGDDIYRAIALSSAEMAARVLFISGDLHRTEAMEFVASTGQPALAKPFQLADLASRIGELIEAWGERPQ